MDGEIIQTRQVEERGDSKEDFEDLKSYNKLL